MNSTVPNKSLRPRMATVFAAAFLAGGTAAVGVNRFIDVARTQSQPTVECEPIFVALRDLPSGSPVTVWDVKLRDWPKAMVPHSALRPDSFDGVVWPDGHVARLSLREGQPVLRNHLQTMIAENEPAVPAVAGSATLASTGAGQPLESIPSNDTVVTTGPVASDVTVTSDITVASDVTGPSDVVPQETVATSTVAPEIVAGTPASDAPSSDTVASDSVNTDAVAAVGPTPVALSDESGSKTDPAAPSQSVTGQGWPSAAETAAGSEAAMRFLVVPERIAIMADQLTAPPRKDPPPTPTASVASQPKQAMPRTGQSDRGDSSQPPKSRQPQQRAMQQQPRTTPPSPAVRQRPAQVAPTSNGRPSAPRTAALAPPPVKVEPDLESELANEAAQTPLLKSVFPNMAAGIERIESEMARIRRAPFGGFFQASGETGETDGAGPSSQSRPASR